jgi:hypothetical protein
MLLHPAVIALLLVSMLTSLMLVYSSYYAVLIIRQWDLTSGSEEQLALERRTYLISTILSYVFAFELLSLFLYMFTADNIHTLFVGAMCAAGTLNVNGYGYPALLLKIINFLVAGTWLIINYVDNRAHDYPLIKKKYLFLLIIAPLIVGETVTLANYLLRLRPDVITSCCGSLFSTGAGSIQSGLFHHSIHAGFGFLFLFQGQRRVPLLRACGRDVRYCRGIHNFVYFPLLL